MTIAAEYVVRLPQLPVVTAAEALGDARIAIDRVLTVGEDRPVLILQIEGTTADDVDAAFDADPSIHESQPLGSAGEQLLYRVVVDEAFLELKRLFVDVGGTPQGATIEGDAWRQRARFPDQRALADLRDACVARGGSLRTERLVGASDDEGPHGAEPFEALTEKQRAALRLAYDEGYFEIPKRISLAELADRLGLSTSAASSLLRRAQRELIEQSIRPQL